MDRYYSGSNIKPSYGDEFGAEIEKNHQSQHQQDKNRATIRQERYGDWGNRATFWSIGNLRYGL